MYIDDYLKKKNKKNKSVIKKFISKALVLTFIFLITIICIKKDNNIKTYLDKNVFSKNFSFTKIRGVYTKYFGNILPFDNISIEPVFSEKLEYASINKYNDGIVLSVNPNYLVPVQYSGIVVFVGEKEGLGSTVIIESEDITIWYSNINSNIKLYDEVKKGEYLGETIGDKLYLVFQKDGNIVDYKEYI